MPRYRVAFCVVLITVAVSAVIYFVLFLRGNLFGFNYPVLEIRDTVSGKVYGKWALEGAGEFSIEFIHSVNQSHVRETFKIEGRKIRPVSARFFSFGAGMASDLEEGQKLSRDGDALVISGFSSSYRELNYIVGTVSDHLLFINNTVYSLRDLCGKNAHITIYSK